MAVQSKYYRVGTTTKQVDYDPNASYSTSSRTYTGDADASAYFDWAKSKSGGQTEVTKDEYDAWQKAYSELGIKQYNRPTTPEATAALKSGEDYVSKYLSSLGQSVAPGAAAPQESAAEHAARMVANQQAATNTFNQVATPTDLAASAAAKNSGLVSAAATASGTTPYYGTAQDLANKGLQISGGKVYSNGQVVGTYGGETPSGGSTAGTAPTAAGLTTPTTGKYTPLSPSMLLQGTQLKEEDIARTTGTNIYKRDLAAEQAKIGEFVKMMGNPGTGKDAETYWKKFHDFVYEGKQPIQYQEQGAQGGAGIVSPQATGGSQQGLIAGTVANANTGLAGASSPIQAARDELLTTMDSLVSDIKNGLADQQKAVGLVDKGNKITDLETQIANETAKWDAQIAGNRDGHSGMAAIERDEAYLIRQKNLALLPKIQLLAIQKDDYERAENLAKDNAEQIKAARMAELSRIETELGFLTEDEKSALAKTEGQIERENEFMAQGMVKLTPSSWQDLVKKKGITSANESDYVQRTYNLKTGQIDIWKLPEGGGAEWGDPFEMGGDIVQQSSKTGEIRVAVNVPAGNGNGNGNTGFTPTEKKKLEAEFGADWADEDRQTLLKYLNPGKDDSLNETDYKRATATEFESIIKQKGWLGSDGKMSNENWNSLKQDWIDEFLPSKAFDDYFKKYVNEKYIYDYNLD